MMRLSPLIVASSVLLLSACATKDFVRETVAPVQTSVDGLGTRVQAHDDGIKALDGRLQGSEARIQALQKEAAERAEAAKKLPGPPTLLMSTLLTDDKIKFTSGPPIQHHVRAQANCDIVSSALLTQAGCTWAFNPWQRASEGSRGRKHPPAASCRYRHGSHHAQRITTS